MSNGNMPANPVKGCDGVFIDDNTDNEQWLKKYNPSIGLTKREAFAMAAMQGCCANSAGYNNDVWVNRIAKDAVHIADALLAELSK